MGFKSLIHGISKRHGGWKDFRTLSFRNVPNYHYTLTHLLDLKTYHCSLHIVFVSISSQPPSSQPPYFVDCRLSSACSRPRRPSPVCRHPRRPLLSTLRRRQLCPVVLHPRSLPFDDLDRRSPPLPTCRSPALSSDEIRYVPFIFLICEMIWLHI